MLNLSLFTFYRQRRNPPHSSPQQPPPTRPHHHLPQPSHQDSQHPRHHPVHLCFHSPEQPEAPPPPPAPAPATRRCHRCLPLTLLNHQPGSNTYTHTHTTITTTTTTTYHEHTFAETRAAARGRRGRRTWSARTRASSRRSVLGSRRAFSGGSFAQIEVEWCGVEIGEMGRGGGSFGGMRDIMDGRMGRWCLRVGWRVLWLLMHEELQSSSCEVWSLPFRVDIAGGFHGRWTLFVFCQFHKRAPAGATPPSLIIISVWPSRFQAQTKFQPSIMAAHDDKKLVYMPIFFLSLLTVSPSIFTISIRTLSSSVSCNTTKPNTADLVEEPNLIDCKQSSQSPGQDDIQIRSI